MEEASKLQKVNAVDRPITFPVLVVALDGTCFKTNLLLESVLALLHQKPQYVFVLALWLLRGRAYLKQQIARRVFLEVSLLPYRKEFIQYLEAQRAEGRSIVLATANDEQIACQVADHLKLFDLILASDGTTNLSGEFRRDRLVSEFGEKGYWISHVWLITHRGRMHDDPLVFATKDRTSRILILLMLATAILAV